MTKKEVLLIELESVPDGQLSEIIDFVRFLKSKQPAELDESALLSERALAGDWLRAEEDEAWRDL